MQRRPSIRMRGAEHGVADHANDPKLLLHDHVRVIRSSCRETQDRPRRTPSHCSRPFQIFKAVCVAAQAAGTTYLGVAPNCEDFIAAHTSDNTASAMRDKLLKDYRVRKAKAKKPCISALSNKSVCTFHTVGPWQHLQNTIP